MRMSAKAARSNYGQRVRRDQFGVPVKPQQDQGKVVKEQRSRAAKPPVDLRMSPKFATKAFKQALLQSLAAETANDDGEIDVNSAHSQKYAIY